MLAVYSTLFEQFSTHNSDEISSNFYDKKINKIFLHCVNLFTQDCIYDTWIISQKSFASFII